MGRFSNLIAKAGEVVHQVNDEYQRSRQRQQEQQQQPQRNYGQHQVFQQPVYQQAWQPPPLPPRQPGSSTQQPTIPDYEPAQYGWGESSSLATAPYHAAESASTNKSVHHQQHPPERTGQAEKEAQRLREQYERTKQETQRLQREFLAITDKEKELEKRLREYEAQQTADRVKTDAMVAQLKAEAEEKIRQARESLKQQAEQLLKEAMETKAAVDEQTRLAEQEKREAEREAEKARAQAAELARAQRELEKGTAQSARRVKEEEEALTRQIEALLLNPPPPPPRPSASERDTALKAQDQTVLSQDSASTPVYHHPQPLILQKSSPETSATSAQQTAYFAPPPSNDIGKAASTPPLPGQPRPSLPAASAAGLTESVQSSTPAVPPRKTPRPHTCGVTPAIECIDSLVRIDVEWFVHDAAPEFLVCSRCYVDHVYDTNLRALFTCRRFDDATHVPRRCLFGTNRVKKVMWPQAVSRGNLDNMLGYMKSRPQVDHCPQIKPQGRREWLVASEIPGLSFCKACYEDDVVSGPFADKFHIEELNPGYICDSAIWFVKRMYEKRTELEDWEGFVAEVKKRVQIPNCPQMQAVPASSRMWMEATRGPKGLQICFACYADYFYGSPSAVHFRQTQPGDGNTSCLFAHLNFLLPAQQSISRKDPELFWRIIDEVDRHPYCGAQGVKGGTWYTLPNDPQDFAVCGGCRAGIAESIGISHHLVPKMGVSSTEPFICYFNPGHTHYSKFMQVLASTLYTGSWEPLGEFANVFANVPPCPRDSLNTPPNRRYWGWDDIHICEECYLTFAKGKKLEAFFVMRGEVIPQSRLCDLYSPRMRAWYEAVCTGNNSFMELLDYARQRRVIYLETMPECQRLIDQQKIMALQAQSAGIMGTAYKTMGWSHDAVVGHSHTVGNSYAGYGYENEMVLQGAVYDKQSRELAAGATSGSVLMRVQMLEQRWRAVE